MYLLAHKSFFSFQESLDSEFQNVLSLGNLRIRKLNESIQEHRFNCGTKSISLWIGEKNRFVYSDDNGQSLKQSEDILKAYQIFMSEFKSIESSLEESREMVKELEKSDHSNIEVYDTRVTSIDFMQGRTQDIFSGGGGQLEEKLL